MKKQLILLIFLLINLVSFGQITPISVTAPDNDTPKEAFLKVNANEAYLDTMGVQRLDSLLSAGVGGDFWPLSGNAELLDNVNMNIGSSESIKSLGFVVTTSSGFLNSGLGFWTSGFEYYITMDGLKSGGGGNITIAGPQGQITFSNTNLIINSGKLKIFSLPTTSPCATSGSNTIWNDAGTLKICP